MTISDVVPLPTAKPPAQRHTFGAPVTALPRKTLTGLQQTERTCALCGAVKVTVHERDGGAHREWRLSEGGSQFVDEPPCVPLAGGPS